MADGYWRIKQYSPTTKTGFTTTDITDGPRDDWRIDDHALVLIHPDGNVEHYPWASIVKAEYQPPTHNERGT